MTSNDDDDETLNLRIQCQEPAALARLLELYGPRAKGYLQKHYGHVLCAAEIEQAVHEAASRVWQYAASFDPTRSLKSWFMRIVQRQALNIVNDKRDHASVEFDIAHHDRAEDADEPINQRTIQRLEDLARCIEKLKGNQKAIIRADIAPYDVAGAARLARILQTTSNSIYVSRRKARENLKKCVTEHEIQRRSKRARP
jgi:RNA polymerase sigma factor (sigma-70 family)